MADAPDKRDETSGKSGAADRIVHISLDDPALVARNPDIEHERRVAIFDLIEGNHFRLVSGKTGPFRVRLSLSERGIQFDISDTNDARLETIDISMAPFRRHIRDYFMVCESYYDAIRSATPDKIETIDQAFFYWVDGTINPSSTTNKGSRRDGPRARGSGPGRQAARAAPR